MHWSSAFPIGSRTVAFLAFLFDNGQKFIGISVLRVPLTMCSTQRPVEADEEVFLSSERVGAKSTGLIDYLGSGDFVRVGLAVLVPSLDERAHPMTTRKPGWR